MFQSYKIFLFWLPKSTKIFVFQPTFFTPEIDRSAIFLKIYFYIFCVKGVWSRRAGLKASEQVLVPIFGDIKISSPFLRSRVCGITIRVVHQNAFVWNQLAALLYPFWGPRQTTSQKIGSLRPFLRCSLEIGIFRS